MKKVTKYIKIVFFVLIFVLIISNLMLLKNIINGLEKIDAEIKINTEKFESKIEIAKTNGENANYINSLERNLEKATSLANGFATVFMETINAEILERILEHYERELFE